MVEDGKGSNLYTLVISQYEKSATTHFTLRVYASCDFKLHRIADPYIPKYEKQVIKILISLKDRHIDSVMECIFSSHF